MKTASTVQRFQPGFQGRSWLIFALVAASVITLPFWHSGEYELNVVIIIAMMSIAAMGARLLMLGGLWSFGQGAFMTLGAYTAALMIVDLEIPFLATLPLGGVVAALVAAIVGYPALRLRGVYFSILTMILVFAVQEAILVTPGFSGGGAGIVVPSPEAVHVGPLTLSFESNRGFYYLSAGLFLVTLVVMLFVERSHLVLVMHAIRQNEALTQAVGISTWKYKVVAFMIACFFAGIAGAFSATYYNVAHASVWGLWPSIYLVVFCIIGGLGSVYGPIIGATVILYGVELLRITESLQTILLGVGLLVVVGFLPGGLVGLIRRAGEAVGVSRRSTTGDVTGE